MARHITYWATTVCWPHCRSLQDEAKPQSESPAKAESWFPFRRN